MVFLAAKIMKFLHLRERQAALIQENQSLQHLNTFGVDAIASFFTKITREEELEHIQEAIESHPTLILGGGSNLLLPKRIEGLVLYNCIKGVAISRHLHNEVVIEAGGGMNWHELVLWTLQQGLGGIENLALIPGTVGAAPVQNIGAYGVELKDVFESLRAYDLKEGKFVEFTAVDCRFGYRHSAFKEIENKGRYLITKVRLKLTARQHQTNTSYGAIQNVLTAKGVSSPSPLDIAGAVIEIRRSKLPDWRQLGNAGSFFKNPIITSAQFKILEERMEGVSVPSYPAGEDLVKLAAGWLIDQAGWKGKRSGAVGCYEKQALVIVNHDGANGEEILAFSQSVQADVHAKFGIQLEREVNAIGSTLSE